jgi:hypothetical protein
LPQANLLELPQKITLMNLFDSFLPPCYRVHCLNPQNLMNSRYTPEERRQRNRDACRRRYANLSQDEKDAYSDKMAAQARARRERHRNSAVEAGSGASANRDILVDKLMQKLIFQNNRLYLKSDPYTPVCRNVTRDNRTWGMFSFTSDGTTHHLRRDCIVILLTSGNLPRFADHKDGYLLNDSPHNLVPVHFDPRNIETFPFPGVSRDGERYIATGYSADNDEPLSLGTFDIAVDAAVAVARHHIASLYHESCYKLYPDLWPIYNAAISSNI